jgi:hypothetical protein
MRWAMRSANGGNDKNTRFADLSGDRVSMPIRAIRNDEGGCSNEEL